MSDIGELTYSLRAHAEQIGRLWHEREFGAREIEDVQRAVIALGDIIRAAAAEDQRAVA